MPGMERDVGEAEAALEDAQGRLILRIVAQQGNEVMEIDGKPAVMITAEDEDGDPDVLAARLRLRAVRAGRDTVREQLARCDEHLTVVDRQAPPPED